MLDGLRISYTVQVGDDVASRVALQLAALARGHGYTVETRVGILGDSRLLISRADGSSFTVGFDITAAAGADANGTMSLTGTPVSTSGLDFTMAAAQILDPGAAGTTWTLTLGGADGGTYTVTSDGTAGSITHNLARQISSADAPLVSGTQVFFKSGWAADAQGNPLAPVAGDQYTVTPVNLNTRVDESQQVDTLNVVNTNSPANDTGTITESSISGFGMGGPTVVSGLTFPGGITYSNIEQVNVGLGGGNNDVTIASTSTGATTTLTTGNGDNTVHVLSIGGHASIQTGSGNDAIDVSGAGQVLQLGGLLTLDTGAGNDTVTVDGSQATAGTDTTITGSTITGLGMPVVGEEQTVDVTAAAGTYTLLLPGALPGHGSIALDYLTTHATDLAAALRTAYGFDDISVTEHRTPTDVTFTISFTGTHAGIDFGQISWAGVWTLTAGASAATISAPGYGVGTLSPTDSAATVQQTLRDLYRTDEIAVTSDTPGVYTVTFTGDHAGLDFSLLSGATATPVTQLAPRPDASSSVRVATVHDGTTAPVRDVVQTIDLSNATGGSYVLHFVVANAQGVLQDVHTGGIAWDASAADVLSALSAALNPNNVNPALPYTDNVGVEKHGTTLTLYFRGSAAQQRIAYIDTSALDGTAAVATRLAGIDYTNVETLNVLLGSGPDVVNVQGTSAVTNLSTGAGNDAVYVSSQADVAAGQVADFITGTLAGIRGTLNIDVGTGSQRLLISDEAARVGDANATMTRDVTAAQAVDPNLAANGEIFLTGFAPAGISFRAAPTGDFADGITVWTGFGADTVHVDATHFRAGVNEITSLNLGLGNDNADIHLLAGVDGGFVVNGQGPYEHQLFLTTPVATGDYNTPADGVSVTVDGQPLTAGQFVVEPGASRGRRPHRRPAERRARRRRDHAPLGAAVHARRVAPGHARRDCRSRSRRATRSRSPSTASRSPPTSTSRPASSRSRATRRSRSAA